MKFQSNAAYTLSYSVYTIGYAAILSYASYYLLECGYSNSEIGILLAVSNIFAILLQIATADLADRSRRLSVSGILMILAGCFAGLQILLLFLTGKTLLLFIAYTAALTIHATLQTHLNALSFQMEKSGLPVNFGIDRAIDSLFYSAATMIIGRTIHDAGIRMIPITNLVGCALLVIGLLWSKALLKRTAPLSGQKNTRESGKTEQITLSAFIRRHPRFFVLNFGILLLYFGHQVINGFMLQIVKNVGGTALDMSNLLSVTGVLEIIPLFFSSFLIRKTSSRAIVIASAVGYLIRITAYTIAGSVPMLYLGVFCQLISYPLLLPSIIKYTCERMDPGEAVKGQALYTMMIALGSILGSIAGGAVLDHAGVRALLILCTVLTAVGTAVIAASTEHRTLPEPARPQN